MVTVRLVEHGGAQPRSFVAHFSDLSPLELSGDAKLYIESRAGSSSARFDFGTVSNVVNPQDTKLTEIDEGAPVLFRVKVVDESGDIGKILASVDGIAPRDKDDGDGRKPLLPVRHTDLGEELWQLEIGRDSGPHLVVNNRVPGLGDRIVSDVVLQGLVLPIVLRLVVQKLLSADEDLEWCRDWKQYCVSLLGEEVDWELDADERSDEIEELTSRIARKFVDAKRYGSTARMLAGEYTDG
jgi:hypothetical protein